MAGLGKGLNALIPTGQEGKPTAGGSGVLEVPIDQITPNPRQPRAVFVEQDLEELSASIKEHGVIQPLIVTRDSGGGYVLIAGERRWQASKRAGLKHVPVIVRQATTDQQRLELAIIENVQRADLNPLEEAQAFHALANEFKLSHDDIALRVGKSRVAITNTLRLLKLPKSIQKALVENKISEGHARALLGLENAAAMEAALKTVLANDLTVRQTEEPVRKLGGTRPAAKNKARPSADVADLQERLQHSLGTKVSMRAGKKGKGTITLFYYSNEELDTLLEKLL